MGDSFIAPALSTVQTDEVFALERYEDSEKDRSFYLGPSASKTGNLFELIRDYYMIDLLVKYLRKNPQFKKITLQFPDKFVMDSPIVTQLLQEELESDDECADEGFDEVGKKEKCGAENCCSAVKCSKELSSKISGRKFWILADTAYSSCCVDEVAAEHVNSDLVIHMGDACLNSIQKLPVVYCFGKPYLDYDILVDKFRDAYPDKDHKVCLMANAPYTCHLKLLYERLNQIGYANIIYSEVSVDPSDDQITIVGTEITNQSQAIHFLDSRILLSEKDIKISDDEELQADYDLFHITVPEDPRLLYLSTKFRSICIYNPGKHTISTGPFPSMMKRYRFMHMARTAGTIGILVNTLSLKNTKETINSLANLIKDSGKKHYMFVVGKPNVAKLANFEAIDIWCILGCGQSGIVLDQNNEFYRPIITPYELTMALNPEVVWTGKWVVNFEQILNEISENDDNSEYTENDNADDDAPEFSAVTGQYVSSSRPLRSIQRLEIETPEEEDQAQSNELVQKFSGAVAIKGTISTSAITLQNRQWTGLGSDFNPENFEEDGATVEEGISGVASQYGFDKSNIRGIV